MEFMRPLSAYRRRIIRVSAITGEAPVALSVALIPVADRPILRSIVLFALECNSS